VRLLAKTREPVVAEGGLAFVPSATYDEIDRVDVLFAPGGSGQIALTDDGVTLEHLRRLGEQARWVTSACTGALLLGAAGLLRGYRAATHWAFTSLLPVVGATAVEQRVVIDRNRITGGGVTAGIDIALAIAEQIAGRAVAEEIQLWLEYDPQPQFQSGHPRSASPELVARLRTRMSGRLEERRAQLERLAKSWG
jgi:cyclohexyl-isocyanide hydratase